MPTAAWMTLGLAGGIGINSAARWLFVATVRDTSDAHRHYSRWWMLVSSSVGLMTGIAIDRAASLQAGAIVATVAVLALLQSPLDLMIRRLSRPVTLLALGVLVAVSLARVWSDGLDTQSLAAVLVASLVGGGYALVHLVSPRSLGWGDVLLVVPLALAVAGIELNQVLVWQLLASMTGVVHAVVLRVIRRVPTIPFGPHLLFAAWLVLVYSV